MERGRKPTASCFYLRIHRLPEPAWCGPEQAFAVPVYTSIVIHVDFDENARVFDASCEELDKRCKWCKWCAHGTEAHKGRNWCKWCETVQVTQMVQVMQFVQLVQMAHTTVTCTQKEGRGPEKKVGAPKRKSGPRKESRGPANCGILVGPV